MRADLFAMLFSSITHAWISQVTLLQNELSTELSFLDHSIGVASYRRILKRAELRFEPVTCSAGVGQLVPSVPTDTIETEGVQPHGAQNTRQVCRF